MTRQEFTKFIKSLDKKDLVEIVLDLTKRKKDIQEKIVLEYSDAEEAKVKIEDVLASFNKIPDQVFKNSFTFIQSKEVGQYCRAANKVISTYIEPLIKKKEYYDACLLLQEGFFSVYENLGFSIYKYSTSTSFFNKLEKDFKKCITGADPVVRVKIARLIKDNLSRDVGNPWLTFSMESVFHDYFMSEEWEEERKEILENRINHFLDSFDETRPASDEFSELALELLKVHQENEASQEEIDAYVEKYKFLGDIIRFKANEAIKNNEFNEAKRLLREAENLPTLSQYQLYRNSNLLIKILREEFIANQDNEIKTELVTEVKKNMNIFFQRNVDNIITYLFYGDIDQLDNIYNEFESKPTTKDLYENDAMKPFFRIIKALRVKDYIELYLINDYSILSFSPFAPSLVSGYFIHEIKKAMEDGPTDMNYRIAQNKLALLYDTPELREAYEECKEELTKKYPSRAKLENVFNRVEKENYRW